MKKTISVNLANRNFYIEEDAYYVLDQYIKGIREYYKADDPEGEIVEDFEMRLGELFNDKMRLGHEVVTMELTKEVIAQLGRIEDLDAPEHEAPKEEPGEGFTTDNPQQQQPGESFTEKLKKKLYRDPKNKWLGGVLAGLSVNLGVDVALLRFISVLLLFTPLNWIMLLLYILGWILLPEAKNATDRLRMEGKPLNSENLWQTISRDSSDDAVTYSTADEEEDRKKSRRTVRWNNVLWWVIAFLIVLFVFSSLVWAISMINSGDGVCGLFPFSMDFDVDETRISWLVGLSLLLVIFGIILAVMLLMGFIILVYVWPIGIISRSTSLSPLVKAVVITLWILLTLSWVWFL